MKNDNHIAVDLVIPVLNEVHVLESCIRTLHRFMGATDRYRWNIVIVDNGSTDGTDKLAHTLSETYDCVRWLHLLQRGRGRALRAAWLQSEADVVCYMDVDLSTDLRHIPEVVDAIAVGGYDIAIGSRLMRESYTVRSVRREIISRIYNLFLKIVLGTRFSDAQCGFKAVSRAVVEEIVPDVEDQSWFFDTELLVLAEKRGYSIRDVPVYWVEDDDSRVKIVKTAWDDIKGVLRVRKHLWNFKGSRDVLVAQKKRSRI